MNRAHGAIGLFDSGVGGLTVVSALLRRYPALHVVYVADQAHVPYGGRSIDEVAGFAAGISRFLVGLGCSAIVMACNISSATALEIVSAEHPQVPILGVIGPAVARACAAPATGPIGVLATEGTVRSGAYERYIARLAPDRLVRQVACPDFVPLVELGHANTPAAVRAARTYLRPLVAAGCEQVILGCTHYPYLLPALLGAAAELEASRIRFVDPADETAAALLTLVPDLAERSGPRAPVLLTTGSPAHFAEQASDLLETAHEEVMHARWIGDQLIADPGADK